MKNIYVGNLDHSSTEDQLQQLFQPYGAVQAVTIVKDRDTGASRGFGFVEMTNDGEAQKAIAALNGTQLGGRTLNINEARPKAVRRDSGSRPRGNRPQRSY
jgi:RNA recognition motif-containing protein